MSFGNIRGTEELRWCEHSEQSVIVVLKRIWNNTVLAGEGRLRMLEGMPSLANNKTESASDVVAISECHVLHPMRETAGPKRWRTVGAAHAEPSQRVFGLHRIFLPPAIYTIFTAIAASALLTAIRG